jgi:hypothetical protein
MAVIDDKEAKEEEEEEEEKDDGRGERWRRMVKAT